jgi:3-oxoacyl-[acyl-carrier protein] reductase
MADRYLELVNSRVGAAVASRVGLPRPARLRRYQPGAPLLPGPVLVGATGGPAAPSLAGVLADAGAQLTDDADENAKLGALVLDARSLAGPDELGELHAFFTGRLRRLAPGGRVLVLGVAPDGADVAADAARQALDGIVRSLAKELRGGATANLLQVDEQPAGGAALESAVRFLLSGRAAYVDGQPVRLGPSAAPAPGDWDRPLAGKTALVTGAARGIGAAIAGVLARDGARVIAADLPAAGEQLARTVNRIGGTALQLDIAAADAPERLLRHLAAHTDGLDVLIHNAGITRDRLLANMPAEQWTAVLRVNLQAQLAINAALLAGPQLRPAARVVCLSSTTGLAGNRGQTNYAASKAGVLGMVRASAAAFRAHGESTINAVAPGFIDTEMTARMPFATREVARRLSSLLQAGLPIDVAEAVGWLAWPSSGAVNGQVLRVCGQNLVGA